MSDALLSPSVRPPSLNWQDLRVIRLLMDSGAGNTKAGIELGLAQSTVKFYVSRICRQLSLCGYSVHSRVGIVAWGMKYLPAEAV